MPHDTKPVRRITPSALFEQEIARFASHGWQITSRTENTVQLRKPKGWDPALLGVGTAGLLLGFGLIFLALAVLDYITKDDKIVYFSVDSVQGGKLPSPTTGPNFLLLGLGALLSFVLFACLFLAIGN